MKRFAALFLLLFPATACCQPAPKLPCLCEETRICFCKEGECSCYACAEAALRRAKERIADLEKRIKALEDKLPQKLSAAPAVQYHVQPLQYQVFSPAYCVGGT